MFILDGIWRGSEYVTFMQCHSNSRCTNAPHCDVTRTLADLWSQISSSQHRAFNTPQLPSAPVIEGPGRSVIVLEQL